ncbi:DUF1707 SHOCT-like domain-containing protein [Actinomadura flavalba]|uniref:DUF1707 SHOCT-like domain-containing protein n=1 Tax=Actinomadura flavalba TaxID=1120938 RepID=UPI00047759AE|nr:DUF1707 domain-containing protein [Actinomadura flavalba]
MSNLPERQPAPHEMRASDADRDRVARVLREAAGDGRLGMDELEGRLEAVYAAKTYGELAPITRDLPVTDDLGRDLGYQGPRGVDAPTWKSGVAVMSEFRREGVWAVPETFTAFAFWGGGKIDLRDAVLPPGEVRIRAWAIMGGIDIIVPDDMTVHVRGVGFMGGFDGRASGAGAAGSPRVVISGLAFWGGVNTRRKARKQRKKLGGA